VCHSGARFGDGFDAANFDAGTGGHEDELSLRNANLR
jgi:hypothetical protein